MYCYHLVTTPGIEDLLARELEHTLSSDTKPRWITPTPDGRAGVTRVRTSRHPAEHLFSGLRTIYHAVDVRGGERISRLTTLAREAAVSRIAAVVRETDLEMIRRDTPIAVRCRRRGDHAFQSPDIERAAGTVLVERYRCPVDLETPAITVRVDILDEQVDVGILVTPPEMDRRYTWLYRPRVTLSTVTAHALLLLAEEPRAAVLDPFCGSGTIPLEATTMYPRVFASDICPKAVAGTRANAAINLGRSGSDHRDNHGSTRVAANGTGLCETGISRAERTGDVATRSRSEETGILVRAVDASDPDRFVAAWSHRGITAIVTNPPYGERMGRKLDFTRFYESFLTGAAGVLSRAGTLVLMSSRYRHLLRETVQRNREWDLIHARTIETGGIHPEVFVLRRS